jgi:hypothetical protein
MRPVKETEKNRVKKLPSEVSLCNNTVGLSTEETKGQLQEEEQVSEN